MCKRLLVLILVLGFVSSASATAVTLTLEWQFDDNLDDTSGNVVGGTYSGGTPVYVPGVSGKAISLDGVDDTVKNTNVALVKATQPWTNTTAPVYDTRRLEDATMNFWAKCNAGDDTNYTGIAGWGDYVRTRDNSQFVFDRGTTFYQYGPGFAWGPQADGDWQMITLVYDLDNTDGVGHTVYAYLDGVLAATAGGHALAYADSNPVVEVGHNAGRSAAYGDEFFKGLIDCLQIYKGCATADEVLWAYNNPGGVIPEPATIALLGLGGLALLRRRR